MQHQSPATIFLADQYPAFETAERRSISVITEHSGLKNLTAIKDETLAPGKSVTYHSSDSLALIPVVGNVIAETDNSAIEVMCGELLIAGADTILKICNPYDEHLVNYLLLYIEANDWKKSSGSRKAFDIDKHKNELIDIFCNGNIKISLGKLDMKRDITYHSDHRFKSCFCFVLQGSFEIEGRLLHHHDALAVWNTSQLDIESLGKESIVLIIECCR